MTVTPAPPATRSEALSAVGFCCALLVVVGLSLPFSAQRFGPIPDFLQIYAIVLGTSELLTALLLQWRARTTGSRKLAILSGAFAFSTPLIVANIVLLPNLGNAEAPSQAAAWIWVVWHFGWAAAVTIAANSGERATRRQALPVGLGLGAAALTIIFAVGIPSLPVLLYRDGTLSPVIEAAYAAILAMDAVAFWSLLKRGRKITNLELWIAAAVVALVLDTFVTQLGAERFSLGFYVGRSMGMLSGVTVLFALFADLDRLIKRADVLGQYAVLAEHLPAVALILDRGGACRYVNSAWTELTGQTDAEARFFGYRSVIHPDDLRRLLQAPLESLEDREFRIRQRDGEYRRLLIRAVTTGRKAQSPGFVLTGTDIEELLLAQAAVNESEQRLRTFLASVPQIVWTADASGWIDWYNAAWYEYTGQTAAEAAGWGWQAAHHPEDFQAVMERWPHSIATGEPFEMEYRLRRYDGTFQWFLTRIVPQTDAAGRVLRWYGTNTNIDVQKRELERSARVAQIMQEAFLPDELPTIPGVSFDALYLPAESEALIGGDWYDVLSLPDGRVLISCGDVAGHGLNAAVLAGRYRQSIAFSGLENADPGAILERVNRSAILQHETIATAVVAVADFSQNTLEYAIAGHPPPVVASAASEARMLSTGELPLGVVEDPDFSTRRIELEPDSVVIFYTDGVTEFARDPLEAESRLRAATQRLAISNETSESAMAIKREVMRDAAPRDDVAILVVRSTGARAAAAADGMPLIKKWRFHSSDALTAHISRRALSDFIAAHAADGEETYSSELVIGEAIANTVEHAPGLVEVVIDWSGERPILVVRDTGPGFDAGASSPLPDVLSENGRGLFLIRALAQDVAVREAPGFGAELRCTLPTRRRIETSADQALA